MRRQYLKLLNNSDSLGVQLQNLYTTTGLPLNVFSRLHVIGDYGTNKRIIVFERRDNLAIHGDCGVLSTSTISRHV